MIINHAHNNFIIHSSLFKLIHLKHYVRASHLHQLLLAPATRQHPIDPLQLSGLAHLRVHLIDLSYYALIGLEAGPLSYQAAAHLLLARRVHKEVVALPEQVVVVNLLRFLKVALHNRYL